VGDCKEAGTLRWEDSISKTLCDPSFVSPSKVLYDVLSLRSPLMVPDRSAGPGWSQSSCASASFENVTERLNDRVVPLCHGPVRGLHGPEQLWDEVQVEMLWECSAESPEVLRSVKLMKFVRIVTC